jgi:dTDP-4-dehydrorhamnose reductase
VKILLTGMNGQVGRELGRSLAPAGQVFPFDHESLDLASPDQIVERVRALKPELIVNAAAYTAVDRAESEPELAMRINADAPRIFAEEALRLGAALIHYSTDYVFDGAKPAPYVETDEPNPINVYGRSKLRGERAILATGCRHLILRTSWVYGARGSNFMVTMLRLARERPEVRVVDDQIGAPTWCRDIASATAQLVGDGKVEGLYHLAARGATSWCGFAREIFGLCGITTPVHGIQSAQYAAAAKRPANSVLSSQSLQNRSGIALPEWAASLRRCLSDEGLSRPAR